MYSYEDVRRQSAEGTACLFCWTRVVGQVTARVGESALTFERQDDFELPHLLYMLLCTCAIDPVLSGARAPESIFYEHHLAGSV